MTAQGYVPQRGGIEELRQASKGCHGCDLYRDATQTVFGEGPEDARILVVGEQPGDVEDRRGEPFVGPAGKVLDRALDAAGRCLKCLTALVTYMLPRSSPAAEGKRRIHQTPDRTEIVACRPWLVAEFARIRPAQVVVLGATAAKAILGPDFRVTKEHGRRLAVPEEFAAAEDAVLVATIHPSAVLRADDRENAFNGLVEDLRVLT